MDKVRGPIGHRRRGSAAGGARLNDVESSPHGRSGGCGNRDFGEDSAHGDDESTGIGRAAAPPPCPHLSSYFGPLESFCGVV